MEAQLRFEILIRREGDAFFEDTDTAVDVYPVSRELRFHRNRL